MRRGTGRQHRARVLEKMIVTFGVVHPRRCLGSGSILRITGVYRCMKDAESRIGIMICGIIRQAVICGLCVPPAIQVSPGWNRSSTMAQSIEMIHGCIGEVMNLTMKMSFPGLDLAILVMHGFR